MSGGRREGWRKTWRGRPSPLFNIVTLGRRRRRCFAVGPIQLGAIRQRDRDAADDTPTIIRHTDGARDHRSRPPLASRQRRCPTPSPASTGIGDRLRVGIPSPCVIGQLGQLSLASRRGR